MWLLYTGLDIINILTNVKRQVLRVELYDLEGNTAIALYDNFVVENEKKKYVLKSVGKYSGTAGYYNSTYDWLCWKTAKINNAVEALFLTRALTR